MISRVIKHSYINHSYINQYGRFVVHPEPSKRFGIRNTKKSKDVKRAGNRWQLRMWYKEFCKEFS